MTYSPNKSDLEYQKPRASREPPRVNFFNIDDEFVKWVEEARKRIFSLAAGNRIGKVAPRIMEIGFGKVLYAADKMGADFERSKPFVMFAPDGTCTYNPVRIQRGFTYGALINFEFEGMIATNNSMPNGCGFSMYELIDPPSDYELLEYLKDSQLRLGQDQLTELGKGNHFAGLYYVLDPVTGEDTNRRFIAVHCSGHVGGQRLYHPDSWLNGVDGHTIIHTPHGPITLLEGDAKNSYRL